MTEPKMVGVVVDIRKLRLDPKFGLKKKINLPWILNSQQAFYSLNLYHFSIYRIFNFYVTLSTCCVHYVCLMHAEIVA